MLRRRRRIDPKKKFGGESSSEVRKMLGCLNCKYADCIFICRRLLGKCMRFYYDATKFHGNFDIFSEHSYSYKIAIYVTFS